MSKKIILDAGHGRETSGKRTLNGANGVVREWTMNDMVCRYIHGYLLDYDVQVLRCDDISGNTDRPISERTNIVNYNNPELFISIHHNAASNGSVWSTATGVEVYSHPNKPKRDFDLAKLLTDEMAKLTGLRNRGAKQADFHMVREPKSTVPSVLCEGGFMDSTVDYPVITSEKGQRAYAQAVANVCISFLSLQKKAATVTPVSIRGKSVVSSQIITEFIRQNNKSFNQAIAESFIGWGEVYGIKADIAICQSVIETGWFNYTGGTAVTPEQHNFCGMGVTSLGEKGNSFATIDLGAEAQIQHLFAYACTDPLPAGRPVVSPRFHYVTRGIAPNWVDLSMRWAMTADYGEKILKVYGDLTKFAATYAPPATEGSSIPTNLQTIQVSIGETKYIVDGKELERDTLVYKGEAYLPAAYLAEKLGFNAVWDAKTNITTITKK